MSKLCKYKPPICAEEAQSEVDDVHPPENQPWLDVGIAQAFVVAGEDLVVVAGDDDAVDDVAAYDDAAGAVGGSIRL